MVEWEINKALGRCCGTDRPIELQEEYFAALVETDQGLQRRDYCQEYWQQNHPTVYCYWKSKLPSPDKKKKLLIDDDMLMAFFERLACETEQEKINFRFVLALILMRKRRLKYDSSKTKDAKEFWILKVAGLGDFVEVQNPNLTEEQIQQLSSQVGQILQVELA